MKTLTDTNGRVGVITEDRGDMVFARPLDTPYVTHGKGYQIITATAWYPDSSGEYVGVWYDARRATTAQRLDY